MVGRSLQPLSVLIGGNVSAVSVLHLCHFAPEEAQRAKRCVLPSTFTEVKGLISHYYIYYSSILFFFQASVFPDPRGVAPAVKP